MISELSPEEFNAEVRRWARETREFLRSAARAEGLVATGKLLSSIATRFKFSAGFINVISVGGPRYGFVHTHVGRKYSWKARGFKLSSSRYSIVQGKDGRRHAIPKIENVYGRKLSRGSGTRDWFWSSLSARMDPLADTIGALTADLIVKRSIILDNTVSKLSE